MSGQNDDPGQGTQYTEQTQQGHGGNGTQSGTGSAGGGPSRPTQASMPLMDGEEVLIDARPAWSAYSLQLLVAILAFVGGLAAGDEAVIVGFLIAAAISGYVLYQRRKVRYVVTDRRMMKLTGISSKSTNEAWMLDVRGLKTGASLIERLLGHGHIVVSTDIMASGFGRFRVSGMTFGGISNYEEVAAVIRERQNDQKM
ncbi:PH domain-containing protein [Halorientalis sp. IM1011]|uniref:PH domain-containing protein n=1 Tax=Halorientalis sp. IM1011 TaxID=1932360 RepID=UPI001C12CA82|nr:PH domain-containing protein [Halorientalis sp. IM1011]